MKFPKKRFAFFGDPPFALTRSTRNASISVVFCDVRALAPRASLCSTLANIQGIKIHAHVADFYGNLL